MQQVDFIIVGLGIAGLSICEALEKAGKSFVVFDAASPGATLVSGGVFNPVVLKRFTPAWKGAEQLEVSISFYKALEKKLKAKILTEVSVYRIFKSVEEQNDWMVASDKKELHDFLASEISTNTNNAINAPFGFGKVNHTGTIDTVTLLQKYRENLQQNNKLVSEEFQYQDLQVSETQVSYNTVRAQKIIFTEGASVIKNPFFSKEFLIPNKGEYVIIKAPDLQLKSILKGNLFVIPLGDSSYKVGATYSRDDYSQHTTDAAKSDIVKKLKTMVHCEFEVIDQIAGVRPTTKDRRPLLGALPSNKNLIFFNGLGTRGIMGAPWLARNLCNHLLKANELPSEININRFI